MIITDILMPELDGSEVIMELLGNTAPILAISAGGDEQPQVRRHWLRRKPRCHGKTIFKRRVIEIKQLTAKEGYLHHAKYFIFS